MALVSYLATPDVGEKLRPMFEGMEKKGPVPNVLRALAHSPDLLEAFIATNRALGQTKLDAKLRELAYLKVSDLNGCDYCLQHHRTYGRKAGLTDQQLGDTADFEQSPAYDDLQRDVLRYAEEVTRHVNVSDDLFARLKAKLSDRELVELAMTVGIANFTNRVTETLRFEMP
jgi:uncharacterized peroxidase-related enzyme